MKAEQIVEKLEGYEQEAYEGGFGLDWLQDVGENLKFYMLDCKNNNKNPTLEGLITWIDELAKKNLA